MKLKWRKKQSKSDQLTKRLKLSNRDYANGVRYIVKTGKDNLDLVFFRRKDAEVYRKALRLSTSNLKSTVRKIVLDEGYIRT